jgi:hypothetical protein
MLIAGATQPPPTTTTATTTTTPPRTTTPPQVATTTTTTPPRTTTTATATQRLSQNNADYLLRFEPGIRFRVQIAAARRREVNIPQHFRSYRLEQLPLIEEHDGWFKYTVGSFTEYRDARDYRVHLSNTTTIDDAFVAAYNDSRRITVQEALMASNQTWVR